VSGGEVTHSPRPGHVSSSIVEPPSYLERLDLAAVFPRSAPLDVDLGCGDGSFICALARCFPDRNFLAIERLRGRVQSAARKAAAITNIRIMRVESAYAVRYLLPPGSVSTFYVLFPDPWPKRRHWRRRLINTDFLDATHDALSEQGLLHIATDQLDYFRCIEQLARNKGRFALIECAGWDLPASKFEIRFKAAGAPIYRLSLRKVSPVT
jgi:tRNA (guanine-N7-)-methyltransferase